MTRDVADNFQESLYFEKYDNQAVKKFPYSDHGSARDRLMSLAMAHEEYTDKGIRTIRHWSQCGQVRGKSQRTT